MTKTYIKIALLTLSLFAPIAVSAEILKQEIHVFSDGTVHLVEAELFRRHALNLYTVKAWDMKWIVPIDMTDTKIKFESAYGEKVDPADILEGHTLEIKGKILYDKSSLEYKIEPALIKDLSIKTGTPPPIPVAPVASESNNPPTQSTPQTATPIVSALSPALPSPAIFSVEKLTKYLKRGSKSAEVLTLQKFLKSKNFIPASEEIAGYFGAITENAVLKFQKANALEAVGTVGPKTRALINSLLGSQ